MKLTLRYPSFSTFYAILFTSCVLLGFDVMVQAQPVISGFSPAIGAGGTQVIISGSGFNANSAINVVRFNGIKASVTQNTATAITCIVPANATYGLITVTQSGLTGTSRLPFRKTFNAGTNTLTNTSFPQKLTLQADGATRVNYTADFDEDGWTDIVNMDFQTAKIRIYRNTTQGQGLGFATPLVINSTPASGMAKLGDMDGDGLLDIVTFHAQQSGLSIYRNTSTPGNISFAAPVTVATIETAYDGALEDINNDGKLDLVVLNFNAGTISIFSNISNAGNLGFAPSINVPVVARPVAVATGDFDGDGKTDLIIGSYQTSGYVILKNSGNFTFQATTVAFSGSYEYGCSGDFNNDGKMDFAFTRHSNNNTVAFLNNTVTGGPIIFSSQNLMLGSIINCSDVTGDGTPDLILDYGQYGGTSILQSKGSGSPLFKDPIHLPILSGSFGSGSSVADFDNDGRPDIVKSVTNSNQIVILGNEIKPFYLGDFFPTSGTRKTAITISGGDFNGVTAVKFGGIPASSFTIFNNGTIEAIPGLAASGDVEVVKGQDVVKKTGFTYLPLPLIENAEPLIGFPGAEITIRGKYFATGSNAYQVTFGGMLAQSFMVQNDSVITAKVGNGNSGYIRVAGFHGFDSFPGFTFFAPPVIDSVHPINALPGTLVNVYGKNLNNATGILFNNSPGTNFSLVSNNHVAVNAPLIPKGGWVKAISPYGNDSLAGFYNGPVITGVDASSGIIKTKLIIYGKAFAESLSGNTVTFGTITAKVIEASTNHLTVEIPTGTPSGYMSLTAFGLTSYYHNPFLTTFIGSGTGFDSTAFQPGNTITMDASNADAKPVVGDLTDDRKPDIVYRANNGSIAFAKNESIPGILTFASSILFPTRTITNVLALRDLNGDGLHDLIVQVPGVDDSSIVFRNTGTNQQPLFNEVFHRHVERVMDVADFDGDGKPDLLTANFNMNNLQFYRNISEGTEINFAPPSILFGGFPFVNMAMAADLNADGLPELIFQHTYNNNFLVCRNISVPGKIIFDFPQAFSACNAKDIRVADFDKDGMPDIAAFSSGCQKIYMFHNNSSSGGDISLQQVSEFSTSGTVAGFAVADMDGDEKPDIVVLNTSNPHALVLTNTTTPGNAISFSVGRSIALQNPELPNSSYGGLSLSDFDGDGRADLLARMLNNTRFQTIRNGHGSVGSEIICPGGSLTLSAGISGNVYNWQESIDSENFSNISNDAFYNGANQSQLQINNIPASWSGKYVRCLVDGKSNLALKIRIINYWNGSVNNDWNNPLNWSCATVPDMHSEVVITGSVQLNSNAQVKALYLQQGATVQVGAGYQLVILQ